MYGGVYFPILFLVLNRLIDNTKIVKKNNPHKFCRGYF